MYNCNECNRNFGSIQSVRNHKRFCNGSRVNRFLNDIDSTSSDDTNCNDEIDDYRYEDNVQDSDNDSSDSNNYIDNEVVNYVEISDYTYVRLQEALYKASYSMEALVDSSDWNTFLTMLPQYETKDIIYNKIIQFRRSANLNQRSTQEFLDIMQMLQPNVDIPTHFSSIDRYVNNKLSYMNANLLRRSIAWPASFRMNEMEEMGDIPDTIELLGRDPIELISYKLIDPTLMYLYKDHIQFEYKCESLENGNVCYSNLMSSSYAKYSEKEIRNLHSEAILCPLIVYSDGVALGLRRRVSSV